MPATQVKVGKLAARVLGSAGYQGVFRAAERAFEALGLGAATVGSRAVTAHRGSTFAPELGDAVSVHLQVPGVTRSGLLAVDRALADAVAAAVLGGEPASPATDEWDFGIFVYVVTQVLSETTLEGAPAFVAGLEPRPPEWLVDQMVGPSTIAEFAFEARWNGRSGWVRLFLPVEILTAANTVPLDVEQLTGRAVAAVPARLRLGVGRVPLSEDELRSLRPGDAVLLTEHALEGEGLQPTPESAARIWLSPTSWIRAQMTDGDVEVGRWMAEIISASPTPMKGQVSSQVKKQTKGAAMSEDVDSVETTQLMGGTRVEVEAVVGRVELSFDELARLTPGQVVSTEESVGDPVELVANGVAVARGELVDVEGRLGVRILSLEPR